MSRQTEENLRIIGNSMKLAKEKMRKKVKQLEQEDELILTSKEFKELHATYLLEEMKDQCKLAKKRKQEGKMIEEIT